MCNFRYQNNKTYKLYLIEKDRDIRENEIEQSFWIPLSLYRTRKLLDERDAKTFSTCRQVVSHIQDIGDATHLPSPSPGFSCH